MNHNIILLTDSYKVTHYRQYPPKTEYVYSYFESRYGEFPDTKFFGLQYILKQYLTGQRVTRTMIEMADIYFKNHFGDSSLFNREGWEYILTEHGGRLPISIKAVPEGTIVPTSNVLMTVENTDPKVYWLTNYLETLLVQVWYPTTTATVSYAMKQIILDALTMSGDVSGLPFKVHDFGVRGSTTMESSALGGASHLINFMGTDNVPALELLTEFYGADMAGFSIPASEHSTITSWGQDKELDAFRNMLESYPKGLVACVSDSFNIYDACEKLWGTELKSQIENREGTLVIRPDSGDPKEVLPKILEILSGKFGYTTNDKGYKVLPDYLRVIQGDGINHETLYRICKTVMEAGYSLDNLAFGSGGGLLQQCDRDTLSFAFKCSDICIDGIHQDVFKQPVGSEWKKSKKGRLKLVRDDDHGFTTAQYSTPFRDDVLIEVFRDGELLVDQTLDDIRSREVISATIS